jgi:hypothetical protein
LGQILELSDEGMKWTVDSSSSSLSALVQSFTKSSGIHRVLVRLDTDESRAQEKQEYRLVSQSDLVEYIYQELFQEFSAAYGPMSISAIIVTQPSQHVVNHVSAAPIMSKTEQAQDKQSFS